MSKSLVTEYEELKERNGRIYANALHMLTLPGRQTKWLWRYSRRGLVKEDEVKSKWATNQIWKIHATGKTAFDVWQTQTVNDCVLNKN